MDTNNSRESGDENHGAAYRGDAIPHQQSIYSVLDFLLKQKPVFQEDLCVYKEKKMSP